MDTAARADGVWRTTGKRLRLIVLTGVPIGVLVVGAGSRLAMLLLRVTSPDSVHGVTSDDGFTIGPITLFGTYNLLAIGAAVGMIGVAMRGVVEPWLLGPVWFRHLTCALGSGAVIGSALLHADGVDFRLLQPTWLAITLFVALPFVFGGVVGMARAWARRRWAVPPRAWRAWTVPTLLVVVFPQTVPVVAFLAVVTLTWEALQGRSLPAPTVVRVSVRAAWLTVAALGLVALVGDVRAIA